MDTSVKLQNMFSFSPLPLIILGCLFGGILAYLIIAKIIENNRLKKERMKNRPIVVVPKVVSVTSAKDKYIEQLVKLQNDYTTGICSVRDAYQQMSAIIREFVKDVTGIQVQNYTLQDIKGLRMPILEELIEEYYSPEFEVESEGDVLNSIAKTRGAIERWN